MRRVLSRVFSAVVIGYVLISMALSLLASAGVFRWEIILHRAPFLLVDVAFSRVEGADGLDHMYGYSQHGEYIGFSSDSDVGDYVVSAMVYSPLNNECDDIAERFDVAVWRR